MLPETPERSPGASPLPETAAELAESYAEGEWDFKGLQLPGADLRGITLSQSDLRQANLSGADLAGGILIGADLREADLTGASMRGADLTGANLTGATLTNADLRGAELRRAILERDTLRGADLGGAILICSGGRVDKQLDIRQAIASGILVVPGLLPTGARRAERLWSYQTEPRHLH